MGRIFLIDMGASFLIADIIAGYGAGVKKNE
jgi:hypothetical protein